MIIVSFCHTGYAALQYRHEEKGNGVSFSSCLWVYCKDTDPFLLKVWLNVANIKTCKSLDLLRERKIRISKL